MSATQVGTATTAGDTSSGTVTISYPGTSGTRQAGDVLLVWSTYLDGFNSIGTPSGWTELLNIGAMGNGLGTMQLFGKVITDPAEGSQGFTKGLARVSLICACYRGPSFPPEDTDSVNSASGLSSPTTITDPSVTSGGTDRLLLYSGALVFDTPGSTTNPSWSAPGTQLASATRDGWVAHAVFAEDVGSGATGTRSVTSTFTQSNLQGKGGLVAIFETTPSSRFVVGFMTLN